MIGSHIGPYRLVAELGGGGMGTVYFAEHTVIGRRAAIKVLHKQIGADVDTVARFFTEARAVNEIRHPNIVDITDFGQIGDLYYLVMELLVGETLGERIERIKRCDEQTTIRIGRQVASAVGAAHQKGIIHRDIKPENIFLTSHPDYPDYVKVLDFGIAKLAADSSIRLHYTKTGAVFGTPHYMSPEQCIGEPNLDHHADIYSLGVVLYEMVVGQRPFDGETVGKLIVSHVSDAPVPPIERNPEISPRLSALIMKALEKKPLDRFEGMGALRTALIGILEVPKPPPPPPKPPEPPPALDGAALERLRTRNVGSKLSEIILERIQSDRLQLPTMPMIAFKCLEMLRNPNQTFVMLAAVIEQDPLLAPRLVRLANSPVYAGLERVTSMEAAVSRVGARELQNVLVEFSARTVFDSKDSRIKNAFRGIWEHSLAVAMMSRDLCGRLGGETAPDVAYLAGLLHDVGKPIVGSLLLEAERLVTADGEIHWMTDTMWRKIVAASHRTVGVALARKWELPEVVAKTIEGCKDYDSNDRRCCPNIVRLANALAKREGLSGGDTDGKDSESLVETGRSLLGIDQAIVARIASDIGEKVASVTLGERETRTMRRR